jgi:PAS domain S-box-containing protein
MTVEISEHPITFDGRAACLVIPRDITSEQAALAALKLSQERLQFALDAANEGLWDWDVKTGGGYFGPRYCELLGYAPTELPTGHQSWRSLVHPDDLSRITAERAEQIGRSGSFQTEYRMRKKGGDYIWVQSHGRVVSYTPKGEPERIVGTIADITERKVLEAKFYQAQRLESVGRLAGGIAHDFNNLLTVINGYSEMLMADVAERASDREKIKEIRSAGERAASLTQQLLAFSRRQVLHLQPLNLNNIVLEAEKMLSRLIGEEIRLMTKLSPEIGNVLADPGQMQQVLVSLVVNSRDAMPRGGDLTIETANVEFGLEQPQRHPDLRPGGYVLLAVTDNGAGMSPDVLEHIFEPFFTTKPAGAGTGLGLATVYGIVKQTGGWIWADSEVGQGATFKIYFPRTDEPEPRSTARQKKEVRGGETVLLVEDQTEVRRLVAHALRNYGYKVHDFASPTEALTFSLITSERIDLLVSDVIMPGLIGPDLARQIRSRWPRLPVVLMSGYTDDAVYERRILTADAHYLQKPFTPEALGEKVREALDGAPS